jgi:hypothetical protein
MDRFGAVNVQKDGTIVCLLLSTSPVRAENGKIIGFATLARDMGERLRLEADILEISEKERRRTGQDLHDSLGQHLTGTAFILKGLSRKLAKKDPTAAGYGYRDSGLVEWSPRPERSAARALRHEILKRRESLTIPDLSREEGFSTLNREGVSSAIMVPVSVDGRIAGVLRLGSRAPRPNFLRGELRLM